MKYVIGIALLTGLVYTLPAAERLDARAAIALALSQSGQTPIEQSSADPFLADARPVQKVKKQEPHCPGCTCGCQEGQECTCSKMKPKAKKEVRSAVTAPKAAPIMTYHYETQCGPNGCIQVRVNDNPNMSFPQQFGVPVSQSSGGYGAGGCGSSSGRGFRIFGRFRR